MPRSLRLCVGAGQAPISWADLIVIAAKVTTVLEWAGIKQKRNPANEAGVSIATLFGAEWQIQLGREDATQPDAEVAIPTLDSSVDEIRVSPQPATCSLSTLHIKLQFKANSKCVWTICEVTATSTSIR